MGPEFGVELAAELGVGPVGRFFPHPAGADHPIGEPIDMALCMGLILSAIQRFPEAIDFLELSVKEHPESAPAAFAMAVALRGMRDLRAAQDWVGRALEFEPGFSEARSLRAMLADELSDAGAF